MFQKLYAGPAAKAYISELAGRDGHADSGIDMSESSGSITSVHKTSADLTEIGATLAADDNPS